jgi:hypothetical protein
MGLFKKLKKAFKKITSKVKKVVKKVVKGVKKVVKKIGSSKILKAIAIAGAAIVTGGAAIGAFTGGAGVAAGKFGSTFANWMMNASNTVSSGALFGSAAGKSGAAKFFTQAGNFLTKTAAQPFASTGKTIGNITAGITDFTGLTTEAGRTGLTPEEIGFFEEDIFADASSKVAKEGATIQEAIADPSKYAEAVSSNRFLDTGAGQFVSNVGTRVATNVLTGAAMQSIQGDPELRGTTLPGGGKEGAGAFDPLRIYASENNINVSDIYNQVLYGNADPSSMYGSQLYSQETIEVA